MTKKKTILDIGEPWREVHQPDINTHPEILFLRAKHRFLTSDGAEIPDPRPIAPPVGFIKQPSLVEQMREMIAQHVSGLARNSGFETFEESDDFEIGDDYEPWSPHEIAGDLEPVAAINQDILQAAAAAKKPPAAEPPPAPAEQPPKAAQKPE